MSSQASSFDATAISKRRLTIALAGNPNSGKTTIFNALTGLRQHVANYPGVTVEKKTGRCKLDDGTSVELIDLPGTYSLISRSPDETVAMEVLRGLRPDTPQPDAVIVVVDASNLQRNLYLVSQLIELGRPMVVALNMMDIAERRGLKVSPEALEKSLGVPVVPVVGHKKSGISHLKSQIRNARVAPLPAFALPEAMKKELGFVAGGLARIDSESSGFGSRVSGFGEEKTAPEAQSRYVYERTPITSSTAEIASSPTRNPTPETRNPSFDRRNPISPPRAWICLPDTDRRIDRYQALAERLLIGDRAGDIAPLAQREPVSSILSEANGRLAQLGIDPMQADVEAHYKWIEETTSACSTGFQPVPQQTHGLETRGTLEYQSKVNVTLSERVDRIFLHKIWGLAIFTAIMAMIFVALFWVADPMMGAIEGVVTWAGELVSSRMSDGPLKALVTDGIFAGVGAVVVFVPQIALLFLFLSILEDSGYLARAAFLMDRLLSKVGLHGKSFIPLLSSFACAIPGIMAARTIENRKDRLATIFVAPFMSCSARLPVYALLISTFFATFSPAARGGILLSLYALGILAAVGTAWVFKRTMLKGAPASFILELPTYKVPQLSQVARQVWVNTSAFVRKAGTVIFCLSVILWAMTYYPRLPEATREGTAAAAERAFLQAPPAEVPTQSLRVRTNAHHKALLDQWVTNSQSPAIRARAEVALRESNERGDSAVDKAVASAQLRHSIAGRFGHWIEPVIRPLGYDWKMGVGLVGAFAAREVFVSTMAITYAAGDDEETEPLASAMLADRYPNGKPVWTPLVAVSLLAWFVLAMQCMSTLAIVKRETGGWKWPIGMLLYMNGLAYVVSLAIYQIGRIWWE